MSKLLSMVLGCGFLGAGPLVATEPRAVTDQLGTNVQTLLAQGVVKGLAANRRSVVIAHEAIANYMEAMGGMGDEKGEAPKARGGSGGPPAQLPANLPPDVRKFLEQQMGKQPPQPTE